MKRSTYLALCGLLAVLFFVAFFKLEEQVSRGDNGKSTRSIEAYGAKLRREAGGDVADLRVAVVALRKALRRTEHELGYLRRDLALIQAGPDALRKFGLGRATTSGKRCRDFLAVARSKFKLGRLAIARFAQAVAKESDGETDDLLICVGTSLSTQGGSDQIAAAYGHGLMARGFFFRALKRAILDARGDEEIAAGRRAIAAGLARVVDAEDTARKCAAVTRLRMTDGRLLGLQVLRLKKRGAYYMKRGLDRHATVYDQQARKLERQKQRLLIHAVHSCPQIYRARVCGYYADAVRSLLSPSFPENADVATATALLAEFGALSSSVCSSRASVLTRELEPLLKRDRGHPTPAPR